MDMSQACSELYRHRKDFIIIGLTGRTGSGCSTVAKILSKPIHEISLSAPNDTISDNFSHEKHAIIEGFSKKNWHPFTILYVRDIISTYILECKYEEISEYIERKFEGITLDLIKEEFNGFKEKSKCLDIIFLDNHDAADADKVHSFIAHDLPKFTELFKYHVDKLGKENFIKMYQTIGDNIRKHGDAIEKDEILAQHIYSLSDRTNQIIKALRNHNRKSSAPDYFVIDAFRNPTEVRFFQDRYSAFYLMAIICDERHRKNRLFHQSIPYKQIQSIDSKEYSRKNILKDINSFISQDISGCIDIADIIINNDGDYDNSNYNILHDQLARYISLIMHPGIVTPSNDERNMQIAFTAKANSGCISRQVGAAVTSSDGQLLSIGWNDSPKNQIPCMLRDSKNLTSSRKSSDFSKYEKNNNGFKDLVNKYITSIAPASNMGLPNPYCFKTFQNKIDGEKNQVYTRSIHAEEAAFLDLIGKSSLAKGGILYTTASPCVLCAKKTAHLGISKVIYIDPYPDISFEHIFEFGDNPLQYTIFSGAIGPAYHKLYRPVVPLKDELSSYIQPSPI